MVAKSLEAAVVVLFIGVLTTGLYAGVVPDYRSATAAEVGDRTLVEAANEVEVAVPANATGVRAERRIDLPTTIRSDGYRIAAVDPASEPPRLELRHPHSSVEGSRSLALPPHVVAVDGAVTGGDGTVVIEPASGADGVVIRLVDGR
ncbi:hypothetical protein GRS48_01015 [Halorubrum sp. JWXQ-INN 858]|uniref:DUF7266 family protein n=1 Tax=Halorubrum sp. JWXQ-INN 858 TaxID=2690782 RepID=UPI00135C3470|nr:hypothetical protein [Halorubrum sp. JWXQ-INN 858]MWV63415.1 hypothetical protein [Halorubrum sp. JWXQ-INN 858]